MIQATRCNTCDRLVIPGPLGCTCRVEPCFACGRPLRRKVTRVDTRDGQTVFVGPDCAALVRAAGDAGYQPPGGGPKLYPMP